MSTTTSALRGRLRRPLSLRRLSLPNPDDPLGLFGDGPPWWTISKGKPWQRPSSSARQAKKRRKATVFKLRWHANHAALLAGSPTPMTVAASALADKLDACVPPKRPCLSGACPVCIRAQQRWFVTETLHVMQPYVRHGYQAQALSLVPECGMTPVDSLSSFDIDKFLDAIRQALKACGIKHYKLGLDVSLNHRAGVVSPKIWQLQMWGFFHEPETHWREQLVAMIDPKGGVKRPVEVKKRDSLKATAAYGVKSTFNRRESFLKANLHREDRGECWDTRDRHLRDDAWVELMLFLDRIGLQRRIVLSTTNLSVPPLHSQNDLRLGGSK
jgi:hypothetical protein